MFGTSDGQVKVFNTVSNTVTLLGKHTQAVLALVVTSNSIVVSGKQYIFQGVQILKLKYFRRFRYYS